MKCFRVFLSFLSGGFSFSGELITGNENPPFKSEAAHLQLGSAQGFSLVKGSACYHTCNKYWVRLGSYAASVNKSKTLEGNGPSPTWKHSFGKLISKQMGPHSSRVDYYKAFRGNKNKKVWCSKESQLK